MELENLRKILIDGNIQEKHEKFREIDSQFLTNDMFENLCRLLSDKDSKVRFFSLYYLIEKFKPFLSNADQKLTDQIYNLIFDEDGPVADRAVWAIGITGNIGLNKLINEYHISSGSTKSRIVMAIGRSNFGHKLETRINILLDAIKSKNESVKFTAMCELMANSPAGSWQKNKDRAIHFERVYSLVLPVAKKFSNSDSSMHREFGERYLQQIAKKG